MWYSKTLEGCDVKDRPIECLEIERTLSLVSGFSQCLSACADRAS